MSESPPLQGHQPARCSCRLFRPFNEASCSSGLWASKCLQQIPQTTALVQVSSGGQAMRNMLRAPDAHVYICGDSLVANAATASLTEVMGKLQKQKKSALHLAITCTYDSFSFFLHTVRAVTLQKSQEQYQIQVPEDLHLIFWSLLSASNVQTHAVRICSKRK